MPPALVLGSGITPLGVVRALGRSGVPAYVLAPRPGPVRVSRWYAAPPHGRHLGNAADLADYLRTLPLERGVLIPTSDHDVLAVARLPPDLAERFPSSQASLPLLRQMLDKERLRELLDTYRLPRPRTITVTGPGTLDALDDDEIETLFVKPRDSQAFNRRLHVKAIRAKGRAELARALELVEAEGLAVVLQEYIPGPPTNHYFLDGFVDRTGRVRARMARRRLRMSDPEFELPSAFRSAMSLRRRRTSSGSSRPWTTADRTTRSSSSTSARVSSTWSRSTYERGGRSSSPRCAAWTWPR